MDMFDFAGMLFGGSRTAPDATTVTATGAGASDGGEVGITLDADVTPAEDTGVEGDADQTIIDLPTSPDVDEGDELIVTLVGDGPLKTPVVTANPGSGDRMRALANSAKTVADAAQAVAEAVNQHFFADTNGIHVTEVTQEEWGESPTGANVLINSIGQLFRDGLNNLLTLTTENGARALTIWDGLGNAASNVLATFGATETHIGMSGAGNVYMANDSFRMSATTSERETSEPDALRHVTQEAVLDSTMAEQVLTSNCNIQMTNTQEVNEGGSGIATVYIGAGIGPTNASDPQDAVYASIEASADLGGGSDITLTADRVTHSTGNGRNSWSTPAGTVLWSSSGLQMAANVTATLDYPVTSCPSGIVLHWQAYASNATRDYDHVYTFIPKQHVVASPGKGVVCQLANGGFGFVGTKYVYVSDSGITGHSSNTATGTASGITYANNHWVLTQVISA